MKSYGVYLDNYDYMAEPLGDAIFDDHANARHVYARLKGEEKPRMPKGGPYWSEENLTKFEDWMKGGFLP